MYHLVNAGISMEHFLTPLPETILRLLVMQIRRIIPNISTLLFSLSVLFTPFAKGVITFSGKYRRF